MLSINTLFRILWAKEILNILTPIPFRRLGPSFIIGKARDVDVSEKTVLVYCISICTIFT
jgi:hypothetical protein